MKTILSVEEWAGSMDEKLAELDESIDDLFAPPFKPEELSSFLKAAIEVADDLLEDGTPEEKLALVMGIWDYYDSEYKLIEGLDQAVDFKKILGTAIGSIVEQFDGVGLRILIERVLIPMLVKAVY